MWKSTEAHTRYWRSRKIDWNQAYFTPDHPHRQLIIQALEKMNFGSVFEVGCGAGANLHKIHKAFPRVRVGGIDVNQNAIEEARKHLPKNAVLDVRPTDDTFMHDKSVDVLLSDACLIYTDPLRINKTIREIVRITRSRIIFVELHSPSIWERMKVRKRGYHIYDYKKLLSKHGFYGIDIEKIPKGLWDGTPWERWGYIITARV